MLLSPERKDTSYSVFIDEENHTIPECFFRNQEENITSKKNEKSIASQRKPYYTCVHCLRMIIKKEHLNKSLVHLPEQK